MRNAKKNIIVWLMMMATVIAGAAFAQLTINTFLPVYSVLGSVSDHANAKAAGQMAVFFKDTDANKMVSVYTFAFVDPSGNYVLNATGNLSLPLVVGQTYKAAVVQDANGYGAGPVDVTISGKGFDAAPSMAMAYGAGVVISGKAEGAQPPLIREVRFGRRVYFKHLIEKGEKFITSATPKISVKIEGVGASGVDRDNITILVNENTALTKTYKVSASDVKSSVFMAEAPSVVKSLVVEYDVPKADPLPGDRQNLVTIRAYDAKGVASTSEVCKVDVVGGPLRVIGDVLPYPQPFSQARDGNAQIQYTLNRDGNIDIFLISIAGETVTRIFCASGSEGGSAGANKVLWNGRTQVGELAGNGVYMGTIVSREEGKLLAKFKLSIVQ